MNDTPGEQLEKKKYFIKEKQKDLLCNPISRIESQG